MRRAETISAIFSRLDRHFRGAFGQPYHGNPFRVLIGTILSQRTKDETTWAATARLFPEYPTARALAAARPGDVEKLIYPVGFYATKARTIIVASRLLVERHGGKVPTTMEKLMDLPGVGRKTANCVLVYAFNRHAIPVDTHVHRISNRLGLVLTKTPEETEAALARTLPRRHWRVINDAFVRFGKETCRPIGPRCWTCPVADLCPSRRERPAR